MRRRRQVWLGPVIGGQDVFHESVFSRYSRLWRQLYREDQLLKDWSMFMSVLKN